MKRFRFLCIVLTVSIMLLNGALLAQTAANPVFEVATVKLAPPLQELIADITSGKRSLSFLQQNIDGVRADFGYIPLKSMIMYAYKMKQYQVSGPDWMESQAFEIHAKMPEGSTKEQAPAMMQSLLAERFKLASHRESRELPVYALIVAKDGHKLKEAAADPAPPVEAAAKTADGKDNAVSLKTAEGEMKIKQEGTGMVVSGGRGGQMRMNMNSSGTGMTLDIAKMTMVEFSELLNQLMDRPVMDMTELKGSYQISLDIPLSELMALAKRLAPKMGMPLPADLGSSGIAGAAPGGAAGGLNLSEPSGGSLAQAVQKLGLKLDARKMPVETLIVDKIEKIPTED